MEQNAGDADSCWGSQKITCYLWNWDVHLSLLLDPFLNQINPLHTFLPCIFKIHLSLHLVRHVMYVIVWVWVFTLVGMWSVLWVMTSRCQPGRPQCVYSFMSYDSHMYSTIKSYGREHHEDASGNRPIAPLIVSVGTRWRWICSIVSHPPFFFFFFFFFSSSSSSFFPSSSYFSASFFFFIEPVSLCTAALGLLCSPNISFSTASIALRHVWRGKGPLLRLCLCLLVLQSASQRHYNADKPTPHNSK